MRVLGIDPGAERCGWGVVEGDGQTEPKYIDSGVIRLARRPKEEYQPYKLRLIEYWTICGPKLLNDYKPDKVCSEIVPAIGFNNAVQAQLAQVSIITIQALTIERGFPVTQVGATTVKKRIGRKKDATKVGVRNGMITLLPVLAPRKFEWTKEFDEPDGLAIALTELGYTNVVKAN
jgi:crossover junction endodeoxyribonuclease RuvC